MGQKSALDPNIRTKMVLEKFEKGFPPNTTMVVSHHVLNPLTTITTSSSKETMHRIALRVLITLVSISMSSTKHSGVFIHSQKAPKADLQQHVTNM
jgi:hypothetical protein